MANEKASECLRQAKAQCRAQREAEEEAVGKTSYTCAMEVNRDGMVNEEAMCVCRPSRSKRQSQRRNDRWCKHACVLMAARECCSRGVCFQQEEAQQKAEEA